MLEMYKNAPTTLWLFRLNTTAEKSISQMNWTAFFTQHAIFKLESLPKSSFHGFK